MSKDSLRDHWANLGIAFATESEVKNADPEQTLVASLKDFPADRKLLRVVATWLKEFGDLVHVERLKGLAKGLSVQDWAWLGVLAVYAKETRGDLRYQTLAELAREKVARAGYSYQASTLEALHYEKEQNKPDNPAIGMGFGLPIALSDLEGDSKKLFERGSVMRGNLWLRMRLLFGCNWRADMSTIILLDQATTYYQARKILGCSIETAHRNWNALKEANVRELVKV